MSRKTAEEVEKIERRSVQESEDELSVEEMRFWARHTKWVTFDGCADEKQIHWWKSKENVKQFKTLLSKNNIQRKSK